MLSAEDPVKTLRLITLTLLACALAVATVHAQALTSLQSLRVGYNTRKATVQPQGELKTKIDQLDREITEATRLGRSAELRRLFAKGNILLANREWTDVLDYASSLVLRTNHVVADSSKLFDLGIEQIYAPSIELSTDITARVLLRKTPPTPSAGAAQSAGETVKDLGTFDGVGRDLRDMPFDLELDVHDVADGTYGIVVEVFDRDRALGLATLRINLRNGVDDLLSRLQAAASRAPESLRADIMFPVDRMRNVNRGRIELRTFDPDKDFPAAEAVEMAVKAGKDPFAGKTGDFKRHYLLESAREIMPYHLYVPTSYKTGRPTPLIIALHGLGGTEDAFFDSYEKKLPELAEQHGYIIAAPLGYRVDGGYGWGLGNPPADVNTRRAQERSEQDVMQVLQLVKQQYSVDDNRIYLMGHSLGAIGTWKIAAKYPDIWAAIAPISGLGVPATLSRIAHLPEIIVHGDNDPTVNVGGSRAIVAKLKELGTEFKYIEVPGGNHSSVVAPNLAAVLEFFDAHKKSATRAAQ
jgi:predicted esterase